MNQKINKQINKQTTNKQAYMEVQCNLIYLKIYVIYISNPWPKWDLNSKIAIHNSIPKW